MLEQEHVAGMSLRAIAKMHIGTTAWSLRRHFAHVPVIIENQQKLERLRVQNDRASCKLPARVESLITELERVTANALRRKDYPSALRAIAARLQCLRTVGELTGELRRGIAVGEWVPGTTGAAAASASLTLNLETNGSVPAPAVAKDPRALNRLVRQYYNLAPIAEDDEDGPVM